MSGEGKYNRSSKRPNYELSQFIEDQKIKKDFFMFSPLKLAILGRCSFTEGKEMEKTTYNKMMKTSIEDLGFSSPEDEGSTSDVVKYRIKIKRSALRKARIGKTDLHGFVKHESSIKVVHQDFYNDFGDLFAEI